jgi:hypothetical protein
MDFTANAGENLSKESNVSPAVIASDGAAGARQSFGVQDGSPRRLTAARDDGRKVRCLIVNGFNLHGA